MSTPKLCDLPKGSYPGEYCYRSSVFSSLYPMGISFHHNNYIHIHKVVLSPINGQSLILDCKCRHWIG